MASVQTPVRQPFGVLDSSKLRNLQSIKNRQNAIAPSAPSLKRRHLALDLSDSENVDPFDFDASASKRKKTDTKEGVCKPLDFTLNAFPQPKARVSASSALISRPETPAINTTCKPSIASSAPAAAGRSPTKSKRPGILSNRRTRLNVPAFGSRSRAPLSLAAAVSGTLANKKHKKKADVATLEESKPNSWFFNIYEETEEQQDFVINEWTMTQSACTLDISDDECKTAAREERGKENVPPNEPVNAAAPATTTTTATPQASSSRKDMMTDEPRTPLGDLNPSDFYAEGHDATSVVLVAEDTEDLEKPEASDAATVPDDQSSSTPSEVHAELPVVGEEQDRLMTKSEINDLLSSVVPTVATTEHPDIEAGLFDKAGQGDDGANAEPADIEIWESGSAKDEVAEMEVGDSIFSVM